MSGPGVDGADIMPLAPAPAEAAPPPPSGPVTALAGAAGATLDATSAVAGADIAGRGASALAADEAWPDSCSGCTADGTAPEVTIEDAAPRPGPPAPEPAPAAPWDTPEMSPAGAVAAPAEDPAPAGAELVADDSAPEPAPAPALDAGVDALPAERASDTGVAPSLATEVGMAPITEDCVGVVWPPFC